MEAPPSPFAEGFWGRSGRLGDFTYSVCHPARVAGSRFLVGILFVVRRDPGINPG